MKRNKLQSLLFQQQVLAILMFSFIVVLLWVVSSIYFSYKQTTLTKEDTEVIIPLTPTIDVGPLEILETKKWWNPEELASFTVSKQAPEETSAPPIVSTPPPTSSPSATVVPQALPQEQATESATQ